MIYCYLLKLSFVWSFHNRKCVQFSLTSLGTLKYDYIIKASEMLSFLLLINISITIGLSFLLLIISAIISSETINTLRFFLGLYFSMLCRQLTYHLNIQ